MCLLINGKGREFKFYVSRYMKRAREILVRNNVWKYTVTFGKKNEMESCSYWISYKVVRESVR
jgi:hypothetical protein